MSHISFDLWGSLIKGNPEFKRVKNDMIRQYTTNKLVEVMESERIEQHIKIIKQHNDELVELYGTQPDIKHLFADLCYVFYIPPSKFDDFYNQYQFNFIKYPPLLWSDDTLRTLQKLNLDGHQLFISSNTLFTSVFAMRKAMFNIGLYDQFAGAKYSGELDISKPNVGMFYLDADYHVGDNTKTDGASVNYGIPFYQINSNDKTIVDFYESISLLEVR